MMSKRYKVIKFINSTELSGYLEYAVCTCKKGHPYFNLLFFLKKKKVIKISTNNKWPTRACRDIPVCIPLGQYVLAYKLHHLKTFDFTYHIFKY